MSPCPSSPCRHGADACADRGGSLLPVLEDVLLALPAADVGRLRRADRSVAAAAAALRPRVLAQRGLGPSCTWQRAQAVEEAHFCDRSGRPEGWTPGPNARGGAGNAMEREVDADADPWLCISGGTEWKSFQGGYRELSAMGARPSWIAFRVRVETPEFSGACLMLSHAQCRWGLRDPLLGFQYRGDEPSERKRVFQVLTWAGEGGGSNGRLVTHDCRPLRPVDGSSSHEVAVHLDWQSLTMSVFIDGRQHIRGAAFGPDLPVRYMAVYNLGSRARAAFSELLLGDSCPFALEAGAEVGKPRGSICRRRRPAPSPGPAGPKAALALPLPSWGLLAFGLGVAAAAAAQWAIQSGVF